MIGYFDYYNEIIIVNFIVMGQPVISQLTDLARLCVGFETVNRRVHYTSA